MPSWRKVIISGSDAALNSLTVTSGVTGSLLGTASYATAALSASYALNGGVTQLLAGPNITLSPTNGLGQVTVSATLSGSTIFNTATGSYGSFYDTTTQTNPVANVPRSMSFNSTDITNGVSISGSTSPFNTYIKTTNAGIYNIQFSAQVEKTDSGTDEIVIWLRKNGIDLTDSATKLTLSGNGTKVVAAWNWFVPSAANDYYQIIWVSADTGMRLYAEPINDTPGIPSVIATANRVDQFLSNTGSFSGSFTGVFTGSLLGTASYSSNSGLLGGSGSGDYVQILNNQTIYNTKTFYDPLVLGADYGLDMFGSTGKLIFNDQDFFNEGNTKISIGAGQIPVPPPSVSIDSGDLLFYNNSNNILAGLHQNGTGFRLLSGSFIGNLTGTASFAVSSSRAISSSFASTASFLNNTTNAFIQGGNSFGTTALLGTNDNQSLALETSGSIRMLISSSGNVGILTTNPNSASLHVSGNVFATSFTGSLFGTSSWATNALTASFVTASNVFGPFGSNSIISASFAVSSSRAVTSSFAISSSFATTASFLTGSTNAFIQSGNSFGATALLGTNDNQNLALETSGSIRMLISSSGNVGILTTNPYSPLQVGSYTGTGGYSYGIAATFVGGFNANRSTLFIGTTDIISTQDKGGSIDFGGGSEAGSTPYTFAKIRGFKEVSGGGYSGYLAFCTTPPGSDANTERMRINSSGNVGIGTTAPLSLLSNTATLFTWLNGNDAFTWRGTSNLYTATIASTPASGASLGLRLHTLGATSNDLPFVISSGVAAGTIRFMINGVGNTSIGSTTLTSMFNVGTSAQFQVNSSGAIAAVVGITSSEDITISRNGASFFRATSLNSNVNAGLVISTGNAGTLQSWTISGNASGVNGEFSIRDATAGLSAFTILKSSGNIGIGTITPTAKLSVVGQGTGVTLIGDAGFGSGNYSGISLNGTLSTTSYTILSSPTDTNLYINRPANAAMHFRSNNLDQMLIDSSGNVGIGTTSPAALSNYNALTINGINGSFTEYRQNGTNLFRIGVDNNRPFILSNGNVPIDFYTNSTRRMVIAADGNIGIGTTTPTTYSGYTTVAINNITNGGVLDFMRSGSVGGQIYNNSTSFNVLSIQSIPLILGTNGAERMRIAANGNVGIGTTDPSGKFHVEQNGNGGLINIFRNPNTGTSQYVELLIGQSNTSELRIGSSYNYFSPEWNQSWLYATGRNLALKTDSGYDLRFYAGGVTDSFERMNISSAAVITMIKDGSNYFSYNGTGNGELLLAGNVASNPLSFQMENLDSTGNSDFRVYNNSANGMRFGSYGSTYTSALSAFDQPNNSFIWCFSPSGTGNIVTTSDLDFWYLDSGSTTYTKTINITSDGVVKFVHPSRGIVVPNVDYTIITSPEKGEIVYYNGDFYGCTDPAGPTWKILS